MHHASALGHRGKSSIASLNFVAHYWEISWLTAVSTAHDEKGAKLFLSFSRWALRLCCVTRHLPSASAVFHSDIESQVK